MTSPGAAARSASSSSHRFSPIESKVKPLACLACRKRSEWTGLIAECTPGGCCCRRARREETESAPGLTCLLKRYDVLVLPVRPAPSVSGMDSNASTSSTREADPSDRSEWAGQARPCTAPDAHASQTDRMPCDNRILTHAFMPSQVERLLAVPQR